MMMVTGCAHALKSAAPSTHERTAAPNLSRWLAEHPLPPDHTFGVVELGRTDSASFHVVQIRDREDLHVHQHHDLVAVLQRGRGSLRRGSEHVPMTEGSVVAIPRGVPHAFVNESRQPAAAFVVFTPYHGKPGP